MHCTTGSHFIRWLCEKRTIDSHVTSHTECVHDTGGDRWLYSCCSRQAPVSYRLFRRGREVSLAFALAIRNCSCGRKYTYKWINRLALHS